MTNSTSRRSAKAIPKPEPEPDTSGTPTEETAPESGPTSTTWLLQTEENKLFRVTVPGRGRFTAAGRGYQAKFYGRDKDYIASIGGVVNIWRSDVQLKDVTPAPVTPTGFTKAHGPATLDKDAIDALASAIVSGVTGEDIPF